jgi:hypothetical protein
MTDHDVPQGDALPALGELDITSDRLSLADLARQLDDLEEGSLIDAVLDGGKASRFDSNLHPYHLSTSY